MKNSKNFKYKLNKNAQGAIEFIALLGFVLFAFSLLSLAIQKDLSARTSQKNDIAIREIALTIQNEINLAAESTDGYSRVFKIPEKMEGREYSAILQEGMVYLNTSDEKYAIALPVSNTTGEIRTGNNTIKKEDGIISINE